MAPIKSLLSASMPLSFFRSASMLPSRLCRSAAFRPFSQSSRPQLPSRNTYRILRSLRCGLQSARQWGSGNLSMAQTGGQTRGMKTRSAVKRLCDGCKPVRRKNRVYIICPKNPKHKQRQGK